MSVEINVETWQCHADWIVNIYLCEVPLIMYYLFLEICFGVSLLNLEDVKLIADNSIQILFLIILWNPGVGEEEEGEGSGSIWEEEAAYQA